MNAVAVIVSDIRMSRQQLGLDLAKWALDAGPEVKIVLTFGDYDPDAVRQLGYLKRDIKRLPKPFTTNAFATAVITALAQSDTNP